MDCMKEYHFTGGRPPVESLPIEGFLEATKKALDKMGRDLINYPFQSKLASFSHKGYIGLRKIASKRFEHREGMPLPLDNISLTGGSNQAIEFVTRILVEKPGDTVISEELTYMDALRRFRYLKTNIVGIPVDENDGMDVDYLENTLESLDEKNTKPKFLYTIANHQNPTGAILSLDKRKKILKLAQEFDVMIIEDDCYGDIDFEPEGVPPSLYTLDNSERTFFLASFSKILGPGLRLGYLCAPDKYVDEIEYHRFDDGISMFSSAVIAEFLEDNMWNHINNHIKIIKKKREAILDALKDNLSGNATWTYPRGGLFIWIKLPEETNLTMLESLAEQNRLSYSPGRIFHVDEMNIKGLRLSYTHMPIEDIHEGVKVLANCIKGAQ